MENILKSFDIDISASPSFRLSVFCSFLATEEGILQRRGSESRQKKKRQVWRIFS